MLILRLAGWANLGIALMHVVGLIWAQQFFEWADAGPMMDRLAQVNVLLPYLLTIASAALFLVFGLYALSGAGDLRRLPVLKLVLAGVAAIYLLRGIGGLLEVGAGFWPLVFSVGALLIGLGYAFGTWMLLRPTAS
jgi:hypothetical protein